MYTINFSQSKFGTISSLNHFEFIIFPFFVYPNPGVYKWEGRDFLLSKKTQNFEFIIFPFFLYPNPGVYTWERRDFLL